MGYDLKSAVPAFEGATKFKHRKVVIHMEQTELLSSSNIALKLGVMTKYGANAKVIRIVANQLGFDPQKGRGRSSYYPISILPRLREWFYLNDCPEEIEDGAEIIPIRYTVNLYDNEK